MSSHIDVIVGELLKKDITNKDIINEWKKVFNVSCYNPNILSDVVNVIIYHIKTNMGDHYRLFELLEELCYDVGKSGCRESIIIMFDLVMTNINYLLVPFCRGLLNCNNAMINEHKKRVFMRIIDKFFTHEFRKGLSLSTFSTDWDRITNLIGLLCFEKGNSVIIDHFIKCYSKIYSKIYKVTHEHMKHSIMGGNKETLIKGMDMCDSLTKKELIELLHVSCISGNEGAAVMIYEKLPEKENIDWLMISAGLHGHENILKCFVGRYDINKVLTGIIESIQEDLLFKGHVYKVSSDNVKQIIRWLNKNGAVADEDYLLKARRELCDPKYKDVFMNELDLLDIGIERLILS